MLVDIDSGIWIAEDGSVSFFGVPYPTRMTVVRLGDESLWVCSPIELEEALQSAVNEARLSIVSPNKLHHLFLGD